MGGPRGAEAPKRITPDIIPVPIPPVPFSPLGPLGGWGCEGPAGPAGRGGRNPPDDPLIPILGPEGVLTGGRGGMEEGVGEALFIIPTGPFPDAPGPPG